MTTRGDLGTATAAAAGGAPLPGLTPLETSTATGPVAQSQWQLFFRRFRKHRVAIISLFVLIAFYLIAIFASSLAPYKLNPPLTAKVLDQANHGPSLAHWFGTDELGRDQLTRIMYAGRVSFAVGLFVALVSTFLGVAIGSMAGYFGGLLDQILMRFTDLFLVVPGIAIAAMGEKGLANKHFPVVGRINSTNLIIVILSVLFWQTIARVVRGLFLSLKEKEYVEAARASGASSFRIIVRHMIPNIVGPIAVNTTLVVGYAIIAESTLSFLGFGIQPPNVSLGTMLAQSESSVGTHTAYLIYFPGLVLLATVLAVNFLGDGLRDAFDPQSTH